MLYFCSLEKECKFTTRFKNPPAPLQIQKHQFVVGFFLLLLLNLLFSFFFFCLKATTISKTTVSSSQFVHDVAWSAVSNLPAWWVFGPALFPYMACSSGRHSILHILHFFPCFLILISFRRRKHKTQGVMPPSTALLSQLKVHGCKPSHQILVESPQKTQQNITPPNTQSKGNIETKICMH